MMANKANENYSIVLSNDPVCNIDMEYRTGHL